MSKNEKMLAIAVGAFVLYSYWKNNQAAPAAYASNFQANPNSLTPIWVQQLGEDSAQGSITSTTDTTLQDLLAIPQGPGGSPTNLSTLFSSQGCILGS